MNLDLTVVLSNLAGLFLLLGVGYVSAKLKIVPESATKPFSAVLLKIALPCITFTSMIQPFEAEFLLDSVIVVGLTAFFFLVHFALARGLTRFFRVAPDKRGLWSVLVAFCNNGFMGLPVTLALFGEKGLALAVMTGIPFNLLMYSLGAYLIGKDVGGEAMAEFKLRKVLITPINIAVVLGLVFYLTQIPVPEVIFNPLQYLGSMTTPMSMFVTGMSLASVSIASIFKDRDVLSATAVRLVIFPALALLVLWVIPFQNPLVPSVMLVIMAMPSAAIVTSLAEANGGDSAFSAKVIFLTSLLCIITIPLFTLFI